MMALTSRKTTKATIRNWIRVLMKAPYWMATSSIASVSLRQALGSRLAVTTIPPWAPAAR